MSAKFLADCGCEKEENASVIPVFPAVLMRVDLQELAMLFKSHPMTSRWKKIDINGWENADERKKPTTAGICPDVNSDWVVIRWHRLGCGV